MEDTDGNEGPKITPRTNLDSESCNSVEDAPFATRRFQGKPILISTGKSKVKKKEANLNDEKEFFADTLKLQPNNARVEKKRNVCGKQTKCKVHVLPALDKVLQEYNDIPQEWFEKKVWDILCNHSSQLDHHTKEEYFRRVIKWRKGFANELFNDSCVLCDIQKATSKSLRSNLDLDRVNYTHEYYNKFSRKLEKENEKITIKNTVDAYKSRTDESPTAVSPTSPHPSLYSSIVSPCRLLPSPGSLIYSSGSMEGQQYSHDSKFSPVPGFRRNVTPDSEHTESRAERLRQMYMPAQKRIHKKCKPKSLPVQLAPQKAPSKLHIAYRRTAFKGLPLRLRAETQQVPTHEDVQGESFDVKDLGVSYNLPDYNPNIGNRHVSIPTSYSYKPVIFIQKGIKCPLICMPKTTADNEKAQYKHLASITNSKYTPSIEHYGHPTVPPAAESVLSSSRVSIDSSPRISLASSSRRQSKAADVLPPIQYPASILMQLVR